jgi:hypothetical protein
LSNLPKDDLTPVTEPSEAVIVGAEIAAGHDGEAELVVRIRHENGVIATVTLDRETGLRLMTGPGGGDLEALVGRSWRRILAETVFGGS